MPSSTKKSTKKTTKNKNYQNYNHANYRDEAYEIITGKRSEIPAGKKLYLAYANADSKPVLPLWEGGYPLTHFTTNRRELIFERHGRTGAGRNFYLALRAPDRMPRIYITSMPMKKFARKFDQDNIRSEIRHRRVTKGKKSYRS